jgi:hypothetical protein
LSRYNLILTTISGSPETKNDLEEIAQGVETIDPRIRAMVLSGGLRHRLARPYLWTRPTLTIVTKGRGPVGFWPGKILGPKALMKSGEYGRLTEAGFPVPRWTLVTPDVVLNPEEWGPYVVEKPNYGALGAHVKIKRTDRLKFKPSDQLEETHRGRRGGLLVQEFIFTGEWPESFRVYTLLGKAILCYHQTTVGRGKPLSGRWGHGKDGGPSIVSNTKQMKVTLAESDEIVSLCERAHSTAFPEIPLLGFDVVKDADSGKLYILECNSHGPTWPFLSETSLSIQQRSGVDFVSQFDGLRTCSAILAEVTPRLATRRLPFQSATAR